MLFLRPFYPLFLLVFVTACVNQPKDPSIRIAIESFPNSLDPRRISDAYSNRLRPLLFCSLMKTTEDMGLEPWVAEEITKPDSATYLIRLKEEVKFQDGSPLRAQDVQATYESILNETVSSPFRADLTLIQTMEVHDDHTLYIKLEKPYAPFESLLQIGILPEKIAQQESIDWQDLIGCGPYQIDSWKQRQSIRLKRSETYFEKESVKNKGLHFQLIQDDSVRALELMKGSVDLIINAIGSETFEYLTQKDDIHTKTAPSNNVDYVAFHFDDPILKKAKVRRAIDMAINRELIIKARFHGRARQANSLFAPLHWVYNSKLKNPRYDPEKAEKLLDEAGYPRQEESGSRFSLHWKTSSANSSIQMARIIGNQLKQIGIDIKLESYEWATFYQDIQDGDFQMHSLRWVGVADPDMYYYIFHSENTPPNSLNRARYSNPQMDTWTTKARHTTDQAERKEIYAKVQKFVQDKALVSYLWFEDHRAAYRSELSNVKLNPLGSFEPLILIEKELKP